MGKLSDRILFGQYIIKKGYTDYETLNKAIAVQEKLRDGTRLGEILLREFEVFTSQEELDDVANEFQSMRTTASVDKEQAKEKMLARSSMSDVEYQLSKYSTSLNVNYLKKAITLLELEIEYRSKR